MIQDFYHYHYHKKSKLDYLYKENFFSKEELSFIWKELEFLNQPSILESPFDTGTALNKETNLPLKRNSGIFLDRIFLDYSKHSSIHRSVSKIFHGTIHEYANLSDSTSGILNINRSNILVSYYEHGDSYEEHYDVSFVTCLFWLYKEPKRFTGGELFFPQFDKTFPPENNSLLMFPSHVKHLVTPVQIEEQYRGNGFGRYCITLFLFFSN